jgi:hypothetical protein
MVTQASLGVVAPAVLARANHTGTQAISTVSGLQSALASRGRFRWPDYDVGDNLPEREIVGIGEALHQAFGYGCLNSSTRRLFTFWRAGTIHGVGGAGEIRMRRYDNDGGNALTEADGSGAYTIVLQPDAGRDLRDPSPCVDPVTGNLVLAFTDTPSSGSGTTYFRAMVSTDGGDTWGVPQTFATIPFAYARIYGGLKVQPSTDPDQTWELVTTAYYQLNSDPDYVLDYFVTRDGGATFQNSQDLGEAYISEDAHNETALVGVNKSVWLAFSRASDSIHMKYSLDARQTWSAWETISWTVTGVHVAPDAMLVADKDGKPCVFLAVSDRTNDHVEFSTAPVKDLIQQGEGAFPLPSIGQATVNTYPGLIDFGGGQALFTFTKEYSPETYASFHLGQVNYGRLVNRPYGFKYHLSADQTGVVSATLTKVLWDTASSGYVHGADLSSGTVTVKKAGRWRFRFKAVVTAGVVDQALLLAYLYRATGGGAAAAAEIGYITASGTSARAIEAEATLNCLYGDEIECRVNLAGAGNKTIGDDVFQSSFTGEYIGEYGS